METETYQRDAKSKYIRSLRTVVTCKNFANKIEPSLPKGWEVKANLLFNSIEIGKYEDEEGSDSHEFKLVCKLVESIVGKKITYRHGIVSEKEKVDSLHASEYFMIDRRYTSIDIYLMNPTNMPDCEITWKRTWKKEAVLSDSCLGLG